MNIQKVGDFSFAGNMRVCDKPVKVKETISELQDKQISVKVDISKEGLDALRPKEGLAKLRKSVQEMPGHIDFEKEMRFREILPKLQMDPVGSLYSEMSSEWQAELDGIKEYNGSYDLEDMISATMKSYAKQYHGLVQGHADGSRDIYVSDSLEEYHKVQQRLFLPGPAGRTIGSGHGGGSVPSPSARAVGHPCRPDPGSLAHPAAGDGNAGAESGPAGGTEPSLGGKRRAALR